MELNELFDYSHFAHRKLFGGGGNLWDPIVALDSYLKKGADKTFVGKGSKIDPSAKLEGIILIGKNVIIRDRVLIRDGAIIGDDCVIGHATEIKHSIVLNNSNLPHLNYVGDSIVGNNVNLGAGVVLANYKAGSKNPMVELSINGRGVSSGLDKLGVFVGDNVKIGSNSVCDPGTVIGKNSVVYPLTLLRGTIAANKIVKYKPKLEIIDKK